MFRNNFVIILTVILFIGCVEESGPTYYEGGNAYIYTQLLTLNSENWTIYPDDEYTYYQEFENLEIDYDVLDYGAVICYMKTDFGYEMLPVTSVFWTEEGVTYSHEFWFSYDYQSMIFNFTNTHPDESNPPDFNIDIKVVILVGDYVTQIKNEDISTPDKLENILNMKINNAGE